GNEEYIQVQRVEFPEPVELEGQDNGPHIYYKKTLRLVLASELREDHFKGEVPVRTDRNPSWVCHGATKLSAPVDPDSEDGYLLQVESTKARLAPVIERAQSTTDHHVFEAPGVGTDIQVVRGDSSTVIPSSLQHQGSMGVELSGNSVAFEIPCDTVPGTVEMHYVSAGIFYTAREAYGDPPPNDDGSRNIVGEGEGTVNRISGTSVAMILAHDHDPGTHLLVFYQRAHDFEVFSKGDILGSVEVDSTPIGSHMETAEAEVIWGVEASVGNTGEAFSIPGGAASSMPLSLARAVIPEVPLEIWLRNGTDYTLILKLTQRGQTTLTAMASGFTGELNIGAWQVLVAGPINGDSLHAVYRSGSDEEYSDYFGETFAPPPPAT
ncbi:MAG: hypothetical protein MI749_00715, partial [Desulfovibrionales bacterium]|nr:hypothetical protein [Desulfovibrionales bacterium]